MRLLRRIFFYLLAAAYGILCPVVILYAFGYFFSPKEQTLVRTGLVYIETKPSRASLFLEKRRYAKKTPSVLSGLLPGDTALSLMLKNYRPWTHPITIQPGKALTFDKILLVPQRWPQQEIFPDPVKEIIPMPGTNYLLFAKSLLLADIFVYDLTEAKSWPLIATGSLYAGAKILSQQSVPKDTRLLVKASQDGEEKILLLEIKKDKPSSPRDITGLFPEKPETITWEPDEKNILIDIHSDYINHIDLAARTAMTNTLSGIRGFGLFNKKIYALRSTNALEKMNVSDMSGKTLLADASLGETLFDKTGFFRITPLTGDLIVFLGQKGELLANRLPYRFVESGVEGFRFDARRNRLLVFQKDKIGILDFSIEAQDKAFEKGPLLSWIYTKGKNIHQAWWVYDGSHILFIDDDEAFLLEPEPCGAPHVDYVTRIARSTETHYNEETGQFIFTDPETKRLNTLEIIPSHEI